MEVINVVKTEHNLCTQCAAHADLGQFSALFEGEFPLGKLLSGLLGTQETEEEDEKYSGVVCPTCGKHPAGFQPDPAVIGEAAGPGEDPVNIPELSKEEKIRLMEARLKDAVRREEYEEAAKLRDEIRALKEEKQNG